MRGPDVAEERRTLPLTHKLDGGVLHARQGCSDSKAVAGILVVREAQRGQYATDFRNEILLQERAVCGFQEEWALLVSRVDM